MSQTKSKTIFHNNYQIAIADIIKFEIVSFLGRLFLNRKPILKQNDKNLLHLGCANNYFENWVNADFFSYKRKLDWMLDLRFPLHCDDNVWDGVFTEHTLEHLYPVQAIQILKEVYRTMKPGAMLRITVPDLQKYIDYSLGKTVHTKFNEWKTGCEAIRTLTQDYCHLSVWDSILLERCLKEIGFINVQTVSFMHGSDPSLLRDSKERSWETLYIEAQK